jgi:hypothetical protein
LKRDDIVTLAILGGAGAAIYLVVKHQRRTATAAVFASVPPPSYLDILLGRVPEIVKGFMDSAKKAEAQADASGTKIPWTQAIKRGDKFYMVGGQCYATATGSKASLQECISAGVPSMLEGLWRH